MIDSRRAQGARRVQGRRDAAQTTTENSRHWANADLLGPNAALDPGVRAALRSRARYEVENDCYAGGIAKTLVADTIGTGPQLQMLTGNKTFDTLIETLFWKWSQAVDLARKLKLMRRAKFVDGESFASLFTNFRLRDAVKMDFTVLEAEMVASPLMGFDPKVNTDGIIYDDFGNVLAYSVLKEHPGENTYTSYPLETATVRADQMIHLANLERAGQARGCPEIAPALPLFAMRRRYALAVLGAAENAANVNWVMETQNAAEADNRIEAMDPIETYRNMGIALPYGWKMTQFDAKQPQDTFEMFTRAIIREFAKCANMPFNVAAGDSSGYNYASGRMDHQVYFKSIDVERSELEGPICLDKLFDAWWTEARRVYDDRLPRKFQKNTQSPSHAWRWDGREHVDPGKEANAQEKRLTNGTTHRAAEYAKAGKDVDDEDIIAARSYGVTVEEYRQALFLKHMGISQSQPSALEVGNGKN